MSRSPSPASISERSPLIAHNDHTEPDSKSTPKKTNRLPSFIALTILCVAVIFALAAGFAAPAIVEEYVKEAGTFKLNSASIDSFQDRGAVAHVKGTLYLDARKVKKKPVRDLGKAFTWIAKEVESQDTTLEVYLPEYNDALLGTAYVPPVKLNIRNGRRNHVDLLVLVEPGKVDGIRNLVADVVNGKRKEISVDAVAKVPVKSGIFGFGTQTVKQSMHFSQGDNPKLPEVDIKDLQVAEYGSPGHPEGIKATAQVAAKNPSSIKVQVPPLVMEALLPNCAEGYSVLGSGSTQAIEVLPNRMVYANVTGLVKKLPTSLTSACPNTSKSPLDGFITSYLEGKQAIMYVRGGEQGPDTPAWIGDMLRETVIPIPVPVHPVGNMIKNFTLSNVHLDLPTPDSDGRPRLSAIIVVVVNLPDHMEFDVDVGRVRSDADMYYQGMQLGKLDLQKWQESNSTRHKNEVWVQSEVIDAPLEITNEDAFAKVVQAMLFGGKGIEMSMEAKVDVESTTALGQFVVRKIPAKGQIIIKPVADGGFPHEVKKIEIVDSSPESLVMQATVSVSNPTDYSAYIPYVNVSLWCNDTRLGYGWGSFDILPGNNTVVAKASWDRGLVGRELLSQYISGQNTTLTIREESVSGLPHTGLNTTVPMPHMFGKFLKETTMHILSSSATFILFSPIPMTIVNITAHAFYEGKDIGVIEYDEPFDVIAGDTLTPKLPVNWNNNGGFDLIKKALGGALKLDAKADCDVMIGEWRETLWFQAKGLGAKVRF